MNDKQLFKLCLVYLQRGNQPITRGQLIQLLQARLLQENKNDRKNNHVSDHVDTVGSSNNHDGWGV